MQGAHTHTLLELVVLHVTEDGVQGVHRLQDIISFV